MGLRGIMGLRHGISLALEWIDQPLHATQDIAGHGTRPPPVGTHDDVGRGPVERIAQHEHLLEHLAAVVALQQRAIAILRSPPKLLVHGGIEIDHGTAFAQHPTILLAQHGPAARRDDHLFTLGQLPDHLGLAVAKARFALHIEDPGNIGAAARLDLVIAVEEVS